MKGVYRYWRDGDLQDIREPWTLECEGDGLLLRGRREVAGRALLEVEADYRGTVCEAMRVQWRAADARRSAIYQLHGSTLHWCFAGEAAMHRLALPEASLLFPLSRAATGPLLRQLGAGPRTVVLPNIRNSAQHDFLQPLLSPRRTIAEGLHHRYYGGEYGEGGADYWLDERGLVARYLWDTPQGRWESRLDEFETGTAFQSFD